MKYLQFNIRNDVLSSINFANLLRKGNSDLSCFKKLFGNKSLIIGAGPSIEDPIIQQFIVDNCKYNTIVADGATELCLKLDVVPDFIVTDLDGDIQSLVTAEKKGALLIVHSHGDNSDKIKNLVPHFTNIVGTSQVFPLLNVFNFGGFTDGDRCVFLADHFKASHILLLGMDFDSNIGYYSKKNVKDIFLKRKKLFIGKFLIEVLRRTSESQLLNITMPKYHSSIYGVKNYSLL